MNRYEFIIKNLDCAVCAKKVEDAVNALPWVESASLNFTTEKLVVMTEREHGVAEAVAKTAKQTEPDCTVIQKTGLEPAKKKISVFAVLFFLGSALAVTGICLERFTEFQTAALALTWTGILLALSKTVSRAVNQIVRSHSIDENLLMAFSCICALAIGESLEAYMVVALYQIGKFFEQKALDKTRSSVRSLLLVKPETAEVEDADGTVLHLPLSEVECGSTIIVKAGDVIPLDGTVESGSCSLDTSSLTGESVPAFVAAGDKVLSGSVNLDGVLKIRTTDTDANSTISRILQLVETASERKTKTETVVTKAVKYYVPTVMACAVLVGLLFGLAGGYSVKDSLYKGMIFLAVSCPCAIAISVPMSYFCAIGNASSKGILIKGTNYLDNLSSVGILAVDKTGTLTDGNFSVAEIRTENGTDREEALRFAWLCERNSNHPIARAIVKAAGEKAEAWAASRSETVEVHEIAGSGITCVANGDEISLTRGESDEITASTAVDLIVNGSKRATFILRDEIKNGTAEAIAALQSEGVKTVMLTGDNAGVAEQTAERLGISEWHAELMPDDKFRIMEELISSKPKKHSAVAYVGDGINDAPVLSRADIGIAMGIGGSSATVEGADVVLMNDNLTGLTEARKLSSFTKRIVAENIILTLAVKFLFVGLGLAGVTGLAWAVFSDVGLAVCTILNSLRVLRFRK